MPLLVEEFTEMLRTRLPSSSSALQIYSQQLLQAQQLIRRRRLEQWRCGVKGEDGPLHVDCWELLHKKCGLLSTSNFRFEDMDKQSQHFDDACLCRCVAGLLWRFKGTLPFVALSSLLSMVLGGIFNIAFFHGNLGVPPKGHPPLFLGGVGIVGAPLNSHNSSPFPKTKPARCLFRHAVSLPSGRH